MIFETLYQSAQRNELLLINGGYCRWHLRRDGLIVIYEIISTRLGAGSEMLSMLKAHGNPIQAKCPVDLIANKWYRRKGFVLVGTETTRSGRGLNVWQCQP